MKGRTDTINHILKEEIKIPREKTKLAYMAGLLDGEGCLRIDERKNRGRRITVSVSNTDMKMINWMKENFGGNIYEDNNAKYGWKACYQLQIRKTKDIYKLLKAVSPYLITKKEKAKELIKRAEEIIKRYKR